MALSLSAKSISLPLLCKSPPSCGDVSLTTSGVAKLKLPLASVFKKPSVTILLGNVSV